MNIHGLRAAAQLSPIRINAAGAQDARGPAIAPASLILDARQGTSRQRNSINLLAIGSPQEIDRDPHASGIPAFDLLDAVILPAFANTHTHLDLTHIGPRPHDPAAGFMPWVQMIRTGRAETEDQVSASVARGIELSRAAGVVAVGDIAGALRNAPPRASLTPWRAMRDAGMQGISFLEFFAIGAGRDRYLQWLPALLEEALRESRPETDRVQIGLQPHAPNTVCLAAYRWACAYASAHDIPITTHLAESPEERSFIAESTGPMRELLERLGLCDETISAEIGRGRSPVAHLAPTLGQTPAVLAHVNDASDEDIELLAKSGASVAYCPRASEYFAAAEHFGPHRYRDMLAAGINVALGTDSLVNLPTAAAKTPAEGGAGMSILDEMRLLWKRDRADPQMLLAMGTVNAAAALRMEPEAFLLRRGSLLAGLVSVWVGPAAAVRNGQPAQWALEATNPAELLFN